MRKFYCNAKKGYCEKEICGSCKKYDGTGGNYIEVDENRKPTNFDKITESVESLAEFLAPRIICADCPYWKNKNCVASLPCEEALQEWLQKECE